MTPQQIRTQISAGTVAIVGKTSEGEIGGTGFIVDKADGYVVTNAHVVQGATAFTIRFGDDSETTARVVARATCDDIAVLKLAEVPDTATQLTLGDSNSVQSADTVYALGYPASFQDFASEKPAFTNGLVQTTGVKVTPDASLPTYTDTIQHSAVLNPGNSGGPLVNAEGQVVGINTLTNVGTASQRVQGQFYSIAIDHAEPIITQLEHGNSSNYLGGSFLPVSEANLPGMFQNAAAGDEAAAFLHANNIDGLLLDADPDPGSALDARYGFGDLITSADETPVTTVSDMCAVLESTAPGSKIKFSGWYIDDPSSADFGKQWTDEVVLPR